MEPFMEALKALLRRFSRKAAAEVVLTALAREVRRRGPVEVRRRPPSVRFKYPELVRTGSRRRPSGSS